MSTRFMVIPLVALLTGCSSTDEPFGEPLPENHSLSIVSSRSDFVSGDDALIKGMQDGMSAHVDDRALSIRPVGEYTLVSGLPPGDHEILFFAGDKPAGQLAYTAYPRQGPMLSGPHQAPYFCQTHEFVPGPGLAPLGPSNPPLCEVETRQDGFIPGEGDGYEPAGLKEPTVLVETGVINRAVYQLAMPANWRGKLVYKFGGGCRSGWYRQGQASAGVLDRHLLAAGYAVASASLNVFGVNCNDLLASETMAMVKERFIEHYGPPAFTIGYGCSGGSYQAHQISDNYPGLLDGILVGCSFPEVGHGMLTALVDARLLKRYFDWANNETEVTWSESQQMAVSGFANVGVLTQMANGASRIVSVPVEAWLTAEFHDVVPVSERFDPETNPKGARPTVFDHTANVYGVDPETGYARWALDNRGIQYGLGALQAGIISPGQFIHLNRFVGGLDRNGNFVPERIRHDPQATRVAYASGRILDAGLGLREIPIIDYRAWVDTRLTGDTHLAYHTYSTRERLRAVNGNVDNHVILTEDGLCEGCSLFSLRSNVLAEALAQLDLWLTAIQTDPTPDVTTRIRSSKPAGLVDACFVNNEKIVETQGSAEGSCAESFPVYGFPRGVAGAPLANNIVACARRPIVGADLAGLTTAQADELSDVFRTGICDWSKAGEEQVRASTWWRAPM